MELCMMLKVFGLNLSNQCTYLNMQVTTTKLMKPTFFSFLSDVRIKEKSIFNFFVDWCAPFVYVI